ncbi:MAG TPA: RNA polymerase sigma factor [Gemmataceae bacterium]|jgi:RNA polymerase sigma-70 factor (ECF subfamily)
MDGDRVGQETLLRAAVLAGDERAWRVWYNAAADGLRRYVHWRCGGLADLADEVVQETWLTAVRRLRAFRPERGPFAAWLCGIAANLLRNRLRRRRAERLTVAVVAPDRIAACDQAENVTRALAELPPHYERVLRAKYVDGLSVQAIAADWGESAKAVESLLTRARQAFREAYQSAESADG